METLDRYWGAITAFLTQSWFSIGQTEVTPERIFGLVVILSLSWWGCSPSNAASSTSPAVAPASR